MHSELAGHERERCALVVPSRSPGNRTISHLADGTPPYDARSIQVGDDRGPIQLVLTSTGINRLTVAVETAQIADLGSRLLPLDRVCCDRSRAGQR